MELWCGVYDKGTLFPVTIARDATVSALQRAIYNDQGYQSFSYSELTLFLARKDGVWLKYDAGRIEALLYGPVDQAYITMAPILRLNHPTLFGTTALTPQDSDPEIHILVQLPMSDRVPSTRPSILWYGQKDSYQQGEGVRLDDPRTLARSALTDQIIQRLDDGRVLLVRSPPMSGKTSLMSLVAKRLLDRYSSGGGRVAVITFTTLNMGTRTFEQHFEQTCAVDFGYATDALTRRAGYRVYLLVDETQAIYNDESGSSPRSKSRVFWETVKRLRSDRELELRILMFAAYGSGFEYTRLSTPVDLPEASLISLGEMNFTRTEIDEYVLKWFLGFECLRGGNQLKQFGDALEQVTGRLTGLCAAAIFKLNELYRSRERSATDLPSPTEWVLKLRTGSLEKDMDGELFDFMAGTRAVKVLKTLPVEQRDRLERVLFRGAVDADIVEECVKRGIMAELAPRKPPAFSSPIMWRYFMKERVGRIDRAIDPPQTLSDLVTRVVRSMDYEATRQSYGRSAATGIPLERVWQMEFYKAANRCTPSTYLISPDVGALFGSTGFVDFTIHESECEGESDGDRNSSFLWGIELLRERSRLAEHIARFAPGGRYASLGFSQHCLMDFRRVVSIDAGVMAAVEQDMARCRELVVVCYDARMKNVVVFDSAMEILHEIHSGPVQ